MKFEISDNDIIESFDDMKRLPRYIKMVKWYYKPLWIVLVAINIIIFLLVAVCAYCIWAMLMFAAIIRYAVRKITPKIGGKYE